MPITLCRAPSHNDANLVSMLRIINDIPAQHELHSQLQEWHAKPDQFDLWFAMFNDRAVGYALVQGSELRGFAVHSATRRRGVGKRILVLLNTEYAPLSWPEGVNYPFLTGVLDELKQI